MIKVKRRKRWNDWIWIESPLYYNRDIFMSQFMSQEKKGNNFWHKQ